MQPYKLGYGPDRATYEYVHPNVWKQERTTGPDRLVIAPSSGHIDLIIKLIQLLPEPFGVLYILMVPRGGGEEGRYQSAEPCSRAELESFRMTFRNFFQQDGRHHLWVMSLPSSSMIVYDNHDVLYAYGPLEAYKQAVTNEGLAEGEVSVPFPHSHKYNLEFDKSQRDIMAYWDWIRYPLTDQDD